MGGAEPYREVVFREKGKRKTEIGRTTARVVRPRMVRTQGRQDAFAGRGALVVETSNTETMRRVTEGSIAETNGRSYTVLDFEEHGLLVRFHLKRGG